MKKLFIVGTPIGNFEDITLRALRTLKDVDVIACEDTRNSQKLLNHFQIKNKKLVSYHNFNEKQATKKIIDLLTNQNLSVALISDAGMPTISDPGYQLIFEAKKNNLEVEIIPGISALTTAITMSSMGPEFTFLGFCKNTKEQQKRQIENLLPGTYAFFIPPHKLIIFLEIIEIQNFSYEIFIAREMTKIHESFYWGNVQEIKEKIKNNLRGEITLILKINKTKKEKVNKYKKI